MEKFCGARYNQARGVFDRPRKEGKMTMTTARSKVMALIEEMDEGDLSRVADFAESLEKSRADAGRDVDAIMLAIDNLCGDEERLWKRDPQEYVRDLRDNDRI